MKPRRFLPLFAVWIAVAGTPAAAQTAPTTQPNVADETLVLSPFTVSTDKDTGYAAANTLAGTRLNTPVKDLGASISIYTKEFISDLGATNANELLVFAVGMEAAGPGGNFSGTGNDIAAVQTLGESVRASPQNQTRTRGLAAPNLTRGYFATNIAIDSYNTEAITVNRGPNAVLFGVGSPAGVIDTSLIRPLLNRNANKVEHRYGNNDSHRATVDFNRVLIPRKLAVRLAGLKDDERYNQRPAFDDRERIFGAVMFEPFKSTALHANFESGRGKSNRPITVLPANSISDQWYAAGKPAFDWRQYDDPALNPNAATQNAATFVPRILGVGNAQQQIMIVYPTSNSATPSLALPNVLGGVPAAVFHPLVNRDRAADELRWLATQNVGEFPAAAFPGGFVPPGTKMQGFTDYRAFDFQNRLLDETSRQSESFHAFNVAVEQRFWRERLGFEIAYDAQRYDTRTKNSYFSAANANHVRVDASVTLPTGQPNPNVGRPYVLYGQSSWSNNFTERDTVRATAFVRYDVKELNPRWGRWLGRHSLTGLHEDNRQDSVSYGLRLGTAGVIAESINANAADFLRRALVRVYLGPSVLGNGTLQLEPIRTPELNAGLVVPTTGFVGGAVNDLQTHDTRLTEVNNGGNATRELITSQATVLQSYWLDEHLVTMFGWRRDEDRFARDKIAFVLTDPDKVHYGFRDFPFPGTPPLQAAKEIKSYSVVLKWPQKLWRLPLGSDASVFYNQSENFTPIGGRQDAFGNSIPSPEGVTKEYGFNFSTLDNKFSLRVNRFETSVTNQPQGSPAYLWATSNDLLFSFGWWRQETNSNLNPHINREAQARLLLSLLPSDFLARNLYIETRAANGDLGFSHVSAPKTDTTDFAAKGTEIEFVFNPGRNWRILANVAQQETVKSNVAPFTDAFIKLMTPVWNQLRDVPRVNYPIGHPLVNGVPAPLPANVMTLGQSLDANVLIPHATVKATEGLPSADQREWRANFVLNHTFDRSSRFKGWSIGGAVRWQDKLGIGFPYSRNPDGSVKIDVAHPYYAPAETNIDGWLAYKRKLWSDRIEWKVQLNVRNLVGDDTPVAVTAQPDGSFATVRLPPEQRWYLTNTFSF